MHQDTHRLSHAHLLTSSLITRAGGGKSFHRRKRPHSNEWTRQEEFKKLAAAYAVLENTGKCFTLRLNEDVIVGLKASSDPVRYIARRITKEFERLGLAVPLFAFALEVTPDQRREPHLHGAIDMTGLSLQQVKTALIIAGGRFPSNAVARQVHLRAFDISKGGAAGWADYSKNAATMTRKALRTKRITYMPNVLRRAARAWWDERRPRGRAPLH